MRIALISQTFAPTIGGVATISRTMAETFAAEGHQVEVVTSTLSFSGDDFGLPYRVHRGLKFRDRLAKVKECDAILQNHVSLWGIALHFLSGRPCAVWLQAPLTARDSWRTYIQAFFFRCYVRINRRVRAISEEVLRGIPPVPIIGNPYNAKIFFPSHKPKISHSILFCGRLNKEKGLHLLIEALPLLQTKFPDLRLTVAGGGPAEDEFKALVSSQGWDGRVSFRGPLSPEQVAELMDSHEVLAIPSIWNEPFGVVALEGIASGCYVVAFPDAGLCSAVGKAGLLCEEKTSQSLMENTVRIFEDVELRTQINAARPRHLAQFQPSHFTKLFTDLLTTKSASSEPSPK